jgi:hypothetical protein
MAALAVLTALTATAVASEPDEIDLIAVTVAESRRLLNCGRWRRGCFCHVARPERDRRRSAAP